MDPHPHIKAGVSSLPITLLGGGVMIAEWKFARAYSGSLAQTVSFRLRERTCLKKISWEVIKEDTQCLVWPLPM